MHIVKLRDVMKSSQYMFLVHYPYDAVYRPQSFSLPLCKKSDEDQPQGCPNLHELTSETTDNKMNSHGGGGDTHIKPIQYHVVFISQIHQPNRIPSDRLQAIGSL
jgi:hypothetical protein